MYSINNLPTMILIGRQTETGVEEIAFDCSGWLEKWPGMQISILAMRPGEADAYPAAIRKEGAVVVWEVNSSDTAIAGGGYAELIGVADGKRKISCTINTRIMGVKSDTVTEPPEAAKPWVDQVLEAAKRAEDAAERAEDAGGGGSGGSGGITKETDPTVPAWAKQPNKPTYTAEEVGAQPKGNYALKSEIPSVPVQSVNGKTGAVQLSASDVGAASKVEVERLSEGVVNQGKAIAQCYSISEYPIFIDPPDYESSGAFDRFHLLDVHQYALCNRYTKNTFYKVDPLTLKDEPLCTFSPIADVNNLQWECGKILPLGRADYDYMLLWSRQAKKIYVCATNGVAVKTLNDQKLGWLKNTGIDIAYNSVGYLAASSTIIYAEYYLPEYVDSSNPPTTINVWRSTDQGKTWTSVFQQNIRTHENPDIYHFHFVRHDPYNPGHWYLGSGDQPSESNIWRSTDDGLTWTKINDPAFSGGLQSVHRSCNLYFTEDYIYWGTDDSVTALGQGNGGKWVRSPRNLESNQLEIEVLADLRDWARIIMPTPYGVLITTEARFSDYGYVWIVPYENLSKPVLVAKIKGGTGVYQLQTHAYGSRVFMRDADYVRDNKLYPAYPLPVMASVMDISMVSRP